MLAFGRRDDQPTFHQSPARRIFHTMSSSRPTHGTFNEIGLLQSVQDDEWIRRSIKLLQDGPMFVDFSNRVLQANLLVINPNLQGTTGLSPCVVDPRSGWIFILGR